MRTYYREYKPSEHNEQASFFDWLDYNHLRTYPEIHPLFFAVSNGVPLSGNKAMRSAMMNKLKAEGFTPGVADTLFLSGRGGYFGLALEFKTPDKENQPGGGLTEGQREFLAAARMEGYQAGVAYGADHAQAIVNDYLSKPKTQDLIYGALKALEAGDTEKAKEILHEVVLAW